MDDSTSVRDLMHHVATKIGKQPADVERFVKILEENWIENVGSVKQMADDQWKSLGIPVGLVNHIKAALVANAPVQPAASKDVPMAEAQIDTGKAVPTAKINLEEEVKSDELLPKFRTHLKNLAKAAGDDKKKHNDCVKTLHKVLENIAVHPAEEKYRQLPKGNKGVQEKILAHTDAV